VWGKLSGTTPWLFAIWGDDPSVWLYRVDNHSLHRDKLGGGQGFHDGWVTINEPLDPMFLVYSAN